MLPWMRQRGPDDYGMHGPSWTGTLFRWVFYGLPIAGAVRQLAAWLCS
jgi:hypothetical protein